MNGAVEQLESVPACAEQIVNPFGLHQHDAEAWDWAFRSTSRGHPAPLLRAALGDEPGSCRCRASRGGCGQREATLGIDECACTPRFWSSPSDPTASMAKTIDLLARQLTDGPMGPIPRRGATQCLAMGGARIDAIRISHHAHQFS